MARDQSYVLVTPARDEERHLEKTLRAVLAQSLRPLKWVIVSDGSTDGTDRIARQYAQRHPWIEVVRRDAERERTFASKAHAFRAGLEHLGNLDYAFIGNLDADCSFEADYYLRVLEMFGRDARLGIAGGCCHEYINGRWVDPETAAEWSVAGAVQLFRRACFESVGGYLPLAAGGIDTAAEILARMQGWRVLTNRALIVHHHRATGCASVGAYRAKYREGRQEYLLGNHPLFEVARAVYRYYERPWLVGSALRLAGYGGLWIRNAEKSLPQKVIAHVQAEQLSRMRAWFSHR